MRLIDADELKNCYTGHNGLDDKASYESIRKMIDNQPTAYDIDKVVEKLKCEHCKSCIFLETCAGSIYCVDCHRKIIEIVKQGGVETDDVCQWKHFSNDKSPYRPSCSQYMKSKFEAFKLGDYCTFCGKRIKVVE